MYLTSLKVLNFRNIKNFAYEFGKNINYFFAPNGTGKTNLLESIQALTIGKTLRTTREKDIIPLNFDLQYIDVTGKILDEDNINFTQSYRIHLQPKITKELIVNNNKLPLSQYLGRVPSIWFGPENIRIINSSPVNKRNFIDNILIQLYPKYQYCLRRYNKALKHRNKLLQELTIDKHQIDIWTEQLVIYGSEIIRYRKFFFQVMNEKLNQLTFSRYRFKIKSIPSIQLDPIFDEDIEYKLGADLYENYTQDLHKKTTTVGPHKDYWDLFIQINQNHTWLNASRYASRGQQRVALIILFMSLIQIFQEIRNLKPIMLLDDIFSELDDENIQLLKNFILDNQVQTFITGVAPLPQTNINQINLYELLK